MVSSLLSLGSGVECSLVYWSDLSCLESIFSSVFLLRSNGTQQGTAISFSKESPSLHTCDRWRASVDGTVTARRLPCVEWQAPTPLGAYWCLSRSTGPMCCSEWRVFKGLGRASALLLPPSLQPPVYPLSHLQL